PGDGPKQEERPSPTQDRHPRRRRRWAAAAAVIFVALLAGLGLTEATGVTNVRGTVIRLFSPDGTLVVEVDDPDVSVSIDGEELRVIKTLKDLPRHPFKLMAMNRLATQRRFPPADLDYLRPLTSLRNITLYQTSLADADLAALAKFPAVGRCEVVSMYAPAV